MRREVGIDDRKEETMEKMEEQRCLLSVGELAATSTVLILLLAPLAIAQDLSFVPLPSLNFPLPHSWRKFC